MAMTSPRSEPLALEISRFVAAPPALVFRVWTAPEHLVRWWGPKDFSATSETLDFRECGRYRHQIHGSDGRSYGMSGTFRQIVEPERIVFTFAWDPEHGQPPAETLVTVTLRPEGDGTHLTFRQEPFADEADRDSHEGGWGECMDRLAAYSASTDTSGGQG